MSDVWVTIFGSAAVTFGARVLPLLVRIPVPDAGAGRRYLDALPISILSALAGGAVLAPDRYLAIGPEIPAALIVVAVTAWQRNLLFGVLAGVAVAALLRLL